jgi:hypothetical protein
MCCFASAGIEPCSAVPMSVPQRPRTKSMPSRNGFASVSLVASASIGFGSRAYTCITIRSSCDGHDGKM